MNVHLPRKRHIFLHRVLSALIAFIFSLTTILPPTSVQAQAFLNLPVPGSMVTPTAGFIPPLIKGLTIYPNNPLEFNFIVDSGQSGIKIQAPEFRTESRKLIKYFLAALTIPDEDMWVNLSPYEKDRVISAGFGQTEMGRDLLAQDYLLKQLMASLTYPEDELGKNFWEKVYIKARQLYGAQDIPVNTFNKIWIVPDKAVVYEIGSTAYVVKTHLKVMLEGDYLALKENMNNSKLGLDKLKTDEAKQLSDVSSAIIKEVLIPEIEKEVNEGKTFAPLRQIYNSMVLATWYKKNLKESLLGQVYVNQNKIKGVDLDDKTAKVKIYQQYLEAFKKGVYNYIKEDTDPATQQTVPRKYFSGGFVNKDRVGDGDDVQAQDFAHLSDDQENLFVTTLNEPLAQAGQDDEAARVEVNLVETPTDDQQTNELIAAIRQGEEKRHQQPAIAMKRNDSLEADQAALGENQDWTDSDGNIHYEIHSPGSQDVSIEANDQQTTIRWGEITLPPLTGRHVFGVRETSRAHAPGSRLHDQVIEVTVTPDIIEVLQSANPNIQRSPEGFWEINIQTVRSRANPFNRWLSFRLAGMPGGGASGISGVWERWVREGRVQDFLKIWDARVQSIPPENRRDSKEDLIAMLLRLQQEGVPAAGEILAEIQRLDQRYATEGLEKVIIDYRRVMTRDEIDQKINEIPKDTRSGIGFDDPTDDGTVNIRLINLNRIGRSVWTEFDIPVTNLTAFTAYQGDLYIVRLERDVPVFERISVKGTEDRGVIEVSLNKNIFITKLTAEEFPEEVKKEFGMIDQPATDSAALTPEVPEGENHALARTLIAKLPETTPLAQREELFNRHFSIVREVFSAVVFRMSYLLDLPPGAMAAPGIFQNPIEWELGILQREGKLRGLNTAIVRAMIREFHIPLLIAGNLEFDDLFLGLSLGEAQDAQSLIESVQESANEILRRERITALTQEGIELARADNIQAAQQKLDELKSIVADESDKNVIDLAVAILDARTREANRIVPALLQQLSSVVDPQKRLDFFNKYLAAVERVLGAVNRSLERTLTAEFPRPAFLANPIGWEVYRLVRQDDFQGLNPQILETMTKAVAGGKLVEGNLQQPDSEGDFGIDVNQGIAEATAAQENLSSIRAAGHRILNRKIVKAKLSELEALAQQVVETARQVTDPMRIQEMIKGLQNTIQRAEVSQEQVSDEAALMTMDLLPEEASFREDQQDVDLTRVGGIDLNPKLLDLQIKRDGNGVPLPLPQQPIGTMNIQGFLPIIVDVIPFSPIFTGKVPLGLSSIDQNSPLDSAKGRPAEDFIYTIPSLFSQNRRNFVG